MRRSRARDEFTPDLFEIPAPPVPLPGAMDYSLAVRRLLSDAIRRSGLTAAQVAQRMTELTGSSVSEHTIHSWCAPSREAWRFPLEFLPAFEVATSSHSVTAWLAGVRGGRLFLGREALEAELGRLESQRDELVRLISDLRRKLRQVAE